MPEQDTLARRFVRALGTNDEALLDAIYDPDVALYTPLAWPVRGRDQVKAFVAQFHAANPGLRVTLHDEFVSPDGTRACFRFVIHFHNTGPFYGNPPTRAGDGEREARGQAARRTDRRAVRRRQQLPMPHQELVTWAMDFPRDTPDPSPVLTEARRDAQPTM